MNVPSTTASKPLAPRAHTPAPAAPTKSARFVSRGQFDAMTQKERDEFMSSGGHVLAIGENENPKHAAEAALKFLNDSPDNVAEALVKGFGLGSADAEELLTGWSAGRLDAAFKPYTAQALKGALENATKSPRPMGYLYLLPGAMPADESRTGKNYKPFGDYKKPGEVPEPERYAAETALMELHAEFAKLDEPILRAVWWERNQPQVLIHARNETRRGPQWPGVFIAKLKIANLHVI